MNDLERKSSVEETPKDVSKEFISMNPFEFSKFLRALNHEPLLSIDISWKSYENALAVKSFLEKKVSGQERKAIIKATEEQYNEAQNVFASGVKWIKVE